MQDAMQWEVVDESEGVVVHISEAGRKRLSDEGLRRAANDNALLRATALTHEILAGVGCGVIVVAIVLMIFRSL